MADRVMVATAPPTPLAPIDGRSKPLSTGDAAAALGMSPRTLRAQLLAAPKDASGGRIVEGEWAGCHRRGLHWRVPAMVVRRRQQTLEARRVTTQRQAAAAAESAVERELRLALAENTAAINRLRMAIAAAFERFAEVVNGGAS
jgi:hypothetical protein